MSKIRSDLLLRQLSKRHSKDLFMTEVKNGSTWDSSALFRMDAVAVKKSWASPCITAYEVKVDRSDFLRDDKWPAYLKYCHRLYFVCPSGLIQPEELPKEVGLIWYNPEKDCISTKRAAMRREIELSADMLYYMLICRTESDRHPFFSNRREQLEAWVADKADKERLAYAVTNKMVEQITEARRKACLFDSVDRKNDELVEFSVEVRKLLIDAGYRASAAIPSIDNLRLLQEALFRKGSITPAMDGAVRDIMRAATRLAGYLQEAGEVEL